MNGKTCDFCHTDIQTKTAELEGERGQAFSSVIEKKGLEISSFCSSPKYTQTERKQMYRKFLIVGKVSIAVTVWVIYLWINAGNDRYCILGRISEKATSRVMKHYHCEKEESYDRRAL